MNRILARVALASLAPLAVASPTRAGDSSHPDQHVVELPFVPIPIVVSGDPAGDPPDSPDLRIDPNTPDSDFAGVASIFMSHDGQSGYICTATPISPYHVISAGHCVDEDDNGTNDFGTNVWIIFNYDAPYSHIIYPSNIAGVHVHPNYTGFNNPNVNDDLLIIELIDPLPGEIPIYPIYREPIDEVVAFTTAGYGTTGTGVDGYTQGPQFDVKRTGTNDLDVVYEDDESGPLPEVFAFDFDGPFGSAFWGGDTLGNDIEHTFGGGDSGGPSFVDVDGEWRLLCINTFTFGWNYGGGVVVYAPYFGSGGGGILVNAYLDWIDSFLNDVPIPGDIDLDDDVDLTDLGHLLATYGLESGDQYFNSRGDVNRDGSIDTLDLGILLDHFGESKPG
jgi:hypothetical protein